MFKKIIKIFLRRWYIPILMIPYAIFVFLLTAFGEFALANLFGGKHWSTLVIEMVCLIDVPLPIIVYWWDIVKIVKNRRLAIVCCTVIQILLSGLLWYLIKYHQILSYIM